MTRRCVYVSVTVSVAVAAFALTPAAETQTNTAANAAAAVATPRMPDGKPDLSGMWAGGGGGGRPLDVDEQGNITDIFPSRRCGPTQVECDDYTNQSYDGEFTGRMEPNRPVYKPEHWDRVQFLDMNTNTEDPLFICQPLGVPRVGPPLESCRRPATSSSCIWEAEPARSRRTIA